MKDYYQLLGVTSDASIRDIEVAYRNLARKFHPDKVVGKDDEIRILNEAYETLKDPAKRQAYDEARLNPAIDAEAYRQAVAHYELPVNPKNLNHYEYYNTILNLDGDQRIQPGDSLDWKEMSNQLENKAIELGRQLSMLEASNQKLTPSQRRRKRLLEKNYEHAFMLKRTWFDYQDRDFNVTHRLYDISIGYCKTDEDREILRGVGGGKAIQKAMEHDSYMTFAPAVISLHKMGLLTPANFKKITAYCWYHQGRDCSRARCAPAIVETLALLQPANMADQAHLDFLVTHMSLPENKIASSIAIGMYQLSQHGLVNQKNLEWVVGAGIRGELMGRLLKDLHVFNLWTPETEAMITECIVEELPLDNGWPGNCPDILHVRLLRMKNKGLLLPEKTRNLSWEAPSELNELCSRINQMFAYGLYLLCCYDGEEKGREVLSLALELKADLRQFIEKQSEEQARSKSQFQKGFIQKLHSHDKTMSEHRAHWKVVVSNVLIAFTGIGLFALGVHYLRTGHAFFAQTRREQLIEQVEQSKWLKSRS